jgi:hypothetical protein
VEQLFLDIYNGGNRAQRKNKHIVPAIKFWAPEIVGSFFQQLLKNCSMVVFSQVISIIMKVTAPFSFLGYLVSYTFIVRV